MQNIVDMGYEPVQEPAEFLTESQMNVLLKSLATMHACSIVYEERNRLSIGEELNDVLREMTVTPDVVFYTAGVRVRNLFILKFLSKFYFILVRSTTKFIGKKLL